MKQKELDLAEKFVLEKIFVSVNDIKVGPKLQFFLTAKGISLEDFINDNINIFENLIKDYMLESGEIDGVKVANYLIAINPNLQGLVIPNVKLIELAQFLDKLFNFESIGTKIRSF